MSTTLSIAKKAKKVIQSCVNEKQLGYAKNYVNLFFERNSTPYKETKLGIVYEADASTVKLYNNLIDLLEKKQKQLNKQLAFYD